MTCLLAESYFLISGPAGKIALGSAYGYVSEMWAVLVQLLLGIHKGPFAVIHAMAPYLHITYVCPSCALNPLQIASDTKSNASAVQWLFLCIV